MKRFIATLAASVLLLPATASAATFRAGPTLTYGQQNRVSGNLYSAAGTTVITADVPGDVVATGGSVSITGRVAGDVLIAGGTIQILGPVGGDVRVAGGTISVGGRVDGDVVLAGGTISVLPDAVVAGDVALAGGELTLAGTVRGGLRMRGGRLVINGTVRGPVDARADTGLSVGPSAYLAGDVTYRAPREATIAEGAYLARNAHYIATGPRQLRDGPASIVWAVIAFLTAMKILVLLGATIVAVWLARPQISGLIHHVAGHFWPSVGHGVVYALLTPLAAALLLVSIIGMIPGAFAILLLIGAMLATKVAVGIFFGAWVAKAVRKYSTLRITWTSALLGVIGFQMLNGIPVFGPLATLVVSAAVFGAIGDAIRRRIV